MHFSLYKILKSLKIMIPFIFLLHSSWVQHRAYILQHSNQHLVEEQPTEIDLENTGGDDWYSGFTLRREQMQSLGKGFANKSEMLQLVLLSNPVWQHSLQVLTYAFHHNCLQRLKSGREDSFQDHHHQKILIGKM